MLGQQFNPCAQWTYGGIVVRGQNVFPLNPNISQDAYAAAASVLAGVRRGPVFIGGRWYEFRLAGTNLIAIYYCSRMAPQTVLQPVYPGPIPLFRYGILAQATPTPTPTPPTPPAAPPVTVTTTTTPAATTSTTTYVVVGLVAAAAGAIGYEMYKKSRRSSRRAA